MQNFHKLLIDFVVAAYIVIVFGINRETKSNQEANESSFNVTKTILLVASYDFIGQKTFSDQTIDLK